MSHTKTEHYTGHVQTHLIQLFVYNNNALLAMKLLLDSAFCLLLAG